MEILKTAAAGTLESSDLLVIVEPSDELSIEIQSSVMNQYGRHIKNTVAETLSSLGVSKGHISVNDKGALDCTIKARTECAVYRSAASSEKNIPWGGCRK